VDGFHGVGENNVTRSRRTRERYKVLAENPKILRFIFRSQRKSLRGKSLENDFFTAQGPQDNKTGHPP
jgi:hypothetical protein